MGLNIYGQENTILKINYSTSLPLSNTDYMKDMSFRGAGFGAGKMIKEDLFFGFEMNWNHITQLDKRKTYYFDGGAITTSLFKYRHQVPLTLSLNYLFLKQYSLRPYAGLGLGVMWLSEKIMYSSYLKSDNSTGFLVQPKIGASLRIGRDEFFYLFTEALLNYSSNRSEDFKYHQYASLNIAFGAYVRL